MASALDCLGIGLSLFVSVICILFDLFLLLSRGCTFDSGSKSGSETVWDIFLREYIRDVQSSECSLQGYETYWYTCENQQADEPHLSYADPSSVFLFVISHCVVQFIWAICNIFLMISLSKLWHYAWLFATATVLLFGGVVASLFVVDAVDASKCLSASNPNLQAKLILPIYFSLAGLLWIFVLILWCMMLVKLMCGKAAAKRPQTGRSLSEAKSEEDFSQKLNKRFDRAEDFEESSVSGNSQDTLVKRSRIVPQQQHHRSNPAMSSSGAEWVYSNEALTTDFDIITPNSKINRESAEIYAAPQSFMRSESRDSEESRRFGRPVSMPPLPNIDYRLPRASLASSTSLQKVSDPKSKSPRKAIRTPSGRSMTATEYLRGGYRPTESPLSEEAEFEKNNVHRYFVKLKE